MENGEEREETLQKSPAEARTDETERKASEEPRADGAQNGGEQGEHYAELQTEAEAQAEPEKETQTESEEKKGSKFAAVMREHFSAPRLAYMAVFTALAYVVTLLEFSVFPSVPFANQLKLDFSNVFFLIEGYIFGPIEAIVSIGIKELLCLADSSTTGVGEVANFIMSTAYVLIPAIGYRFLKGRKWVAVFLVFACAMQIGVSLLVNRYINFPFFGKMGYLGDNSPEDVFRAIWAYVLAFNAIKSISISVVVFLIYKPLSKFIKMTTDKFDKRMAAAKRKRRQKKGE